MIASDKILLLERTNAQLGISLTDRRGIVFVYCPPKVGSTSLVSYIRLFANQKYMVLHIHDEIMLKVLSRVSGVTVNEIINYNSHIGKNVFVLDIYREPIERKMSHFFEKLSSAHFNNSEENLNTYSLKRVTDRFNKVFPYIGAGDHFLDEYGLHEDDLPEFNFANGLLFIEKNGIKYIKLRLKDSAKWGSIMSRILKTEIIIRPDYETGNKPLGKLYANFKARYMIPENLLDNVLMERSFNKFNTKEERESYVVKWRNRQTTTFKPYAIEEYNLYKEISTENAIYSMVKYDHYLDNGCVCVACQISRSSACMSIKKGFATTTIKRIVHQKDNKSTR